MSEYIDPKTLPDGWTLCELENSRGERMVREVTREGTFRNATGGRDDRLLGRWSILRVIDQTPDLPVIERKDIGPGMVVEKRGRFAIRANGAWEGYLPTEYRLVSAPESDPDAELAEQVASLMSVSIEMGYIDVEVARDLIAMVDEYRAGGSDE